MAASRFWRSWRGEAPAADASAAARPYLSLIERKTALRIFLIAAAAALVLWVAEFTTGVIAPHDRWAQPALAALMVWLYGVLRRNPEALVRTQRIAVGGLGVYFIVSTLSALFFNRQTVSPYWVANNFQWMPVISLLLHLTFPWRWAAGLSMAMLGMVAVPGVWLNLHAPDPTWSEVMESLLINGVLMQVTFVASLVSVDRLKHGVGLIVAGDEEGPQDARQALESWVRNRTDELARARDAAESASQAKSRFLAVMSHELRTPLHAMLVSADLLADRHGLPDDPQRDARLLQTIQSSGHHLLSLIDQVLELSRIESGKLEAQEQALDLQVIVQKACAAVKPMAELKGLKLLVGMPDDLPRLRMGDELRLTQVLINLMANAIKFTLQGHVSLTLRRVSDGPEGEDWVRLSVIDTGKGMSESDQHRVFDAFYQADNRSTREHGGVGLGLTITQELVALMKGRLTLKSTPGQGTRVDVDLPLTVLHDTSPMTLTPPPDLRSLQDQLVLIVDDDDVNRMLACEVLRGAGARVHEVDNGRDGLTYLREHQPAVVLMDWRMPVMDGLETTQRLRRGEAGELNRDTPVIGLTANAFEEDRHACLAAGMNNVLTKPVDRQQLLDEVAHWANLDKGPQSSPPVGNLHLVRRA